MTYIPESLRREVRQRAQLRCEYCLLEARFAFKPFEVDHIRAEKHGGLTTSSNLCLCCYDCNHFKGTDLSSVDPISDEITPLFDPRRDDWNDHFRLENDGTIQALTARGRVTVRLLRMNAIRRVEIRNKALHP